MTIIKDRILQIQEKITQVCQRVGRNPQEVTLVAITKYVRADKIQEAVVAGITHIGENRVQDAEQKFSQLGDVAQRITKHMVGHLQTNKVKDAVQIFDMIQSVDSEKLVLEIEKRAVAQGKVKFEVLIEVNSGEEQKTGVAKENLLKLVEKVTAVEHVFLRGLMAMAPLTDDKNGVRQAFRDLRLFQEKITQQYRGHPRVEMKYLSMGMTDDYEIALEEGSNMLRIGRAIFKE